MDKLKQKIKHTGLFLDSEKVEILVKVDRLSEADRQVLEESIDDYDREYTKLFKRLRAEVEEQIDSLKAETKADDRTKVDEATSVMQTGLNILKSQTVH